jgi:hypothetical protein
VSYYEGGVVCKKLNCGIVEICVCIGVILDEQNEKMIIEQCKGICIYRHAFLSV